MTTCDASVSNRKRLDRVYLPELAKQSSPAVVVVVTINIINEQELQLLRGVCGRFVGIGTREKFPKQGDPVRFVDIGSRINILILNSNDFIKFEFISNWNSLIIKS
jgi:hypothetical protein